MSCPECGADGVTWQQDGRTVCDECWLEVKQSLSKGAEPRRADLAEHRSMTSSRMHPSAEMPTAPTPLLTRHPLAPEALASSPSNSASSDPPASTSDQAEGAAQCLGTRRVPTQTHSQCIICGHFHWSSRVRKCRRCGGACTNYHDKDLYYLQRRVAPYIYNANPFTD